MPSYGVMVALGVVLGLLALKRRADRRGLDGALLVDVALWLVIWALVGAKGLLILVELPRYLDDPRPMVSVLRAGGVFLGGFIAAVIAGVGAVPSPSAAAARHHGRDHPVPRPRPGRSAGSAA